MALDIFSTFDDHCKVWNNYYFLMWLIPLVPLTLLLQLKPTFSSWALSRYVSYNNINKLIKLTNAKQIGGSFGMLYVFSWLILFLNASGLFPYTFSLTSHMAVNFPLAIIVWLTVTLLSLSYGPKSHLAHFSPLGAPTLLSPVLSAIELVSNSVRPLTLSVRLTANLSTGHILFNLLGDSFAHIPMFLGILTSLLGLGYLAFEFGVCVVQTYIITLLSSLYIDEHPDKIST